MNMKKVFYLIISGLFFVGCSTEPTIKETITIPPVQRTILVYKGATWCGPCGTSGKPVLRTMESYGVDKVVCLSSQTSDGLNSPAGDSIGGALMKRFNQNGIPHMFEGGNESWTNFYPNQNTADQIMTRTNLMSPLAGVYVNGVVESVNGSNVDYQINVTAKTKFFGSGAGTYKLSILVLEDDIIKGQTGSSNPEHDNVIRGFGGVSPLGDVINNINQNGEQEFSYIIPINNSWKKENLKVAAIIWRVNGVNFDPVNGYSVHVK